MPTIVDRGLTEDYTPTRLGGRWPGPWYPEPAWRRILRMPFAYARKRYVMWRYNLPDPEVELVKLQDRMKQDARAWVDARMAERAAERAKRGETE